MITAVIFVSCDNDDENQPSIVGRWAGDKAEFRMNLIPFDDDNFDVVLEFESDGTVTYTDDDQSYSGTYTVHEKTLQITGVTVAGMPIDVSGNYDIKEVSNTDLVIEGEREGEINDPTFGNISGTVRATLYFTRLSQ